MSHNSSRFVAQLFASVLFYIGILAVNAVLVHYLYHHDTLRPWYLPCLGLLLLPSVILQLVSAVLFLLDKGDKLTLTSSVRIGVLHLLQLGFLWRHVVLFREVDPKSRSRNLEHLNYLQLLCTFASYIPLLLIHIFLLLKYGEHDWVLPAAMLFTLLGACFYLASYRDHELATDHDVGKCSCSGTASKMLWRFGELVSRLLCLVVFATVYHYWIFLILGLHGITILVCLCTYAFSMLHDSQLTNTYRSLTGIMAAYIYSFVFINFQSDHNILFRYSFYYVVMFMENTILVTVWYVHTGQYTAGIDKNVIVLLCACAFFGGLLSLIMYRRCCTSIALFESEAEYIYDTDECINCRLSLCSKHNIKLQRPFSAGWMSQYQKATVANGNYYSNILHDTGVDSDGNSTADLLNSSGEHWQIRDTDLESMKTIQNNQTIAVQGSGTYTHKRFFDSNSSVANFTDTDSISSGSGVYEEDWRQKSVDTIFSQLSALDALSMVSSRTQLLTDSWDNLMKDNKERKADKCDLKHPKKIDILNSLIRKDLDTSFFSDGYTTDHTLESYQLPVTVLAKKRSSPYNRVKIEPAYSTASDSTDCTICAFMRQNPSSPEETRRHIDFHERNQDELWQQPRKSRQREYYAGCHNAASRSRKHNLSTDQSGSERSCTHKYEKKNRRYKRDAIKVRSTSALQNNRSDTITSGPSRVSAKSKTAATSPVHKVSSEFRGTRQPRETKLSAQTIENIIADVQNCRDVYQFVESDRGTPRSRQTPTNRARNSPSSRHTPTKHRDTSATRHTPVNHAVDSIVVRHTPVNNTRGTPVVRQTPDASGSRHTPLSAYLAFTADDNDGTSESSCEMII